MTPIALWLPYEVEDLQAATEFYTVRLGLSEVDRFEGGVVLRAADGAYVELAAAGSPRPAPLAFELATDAEVDAAFAGLHGVEVLRGPGRYPRGHYGFEVRGPAGATVMIWSER
ncbi:VOC family protein [Kutzneria buriramensis]|uniref:Glyoxalase/bleomycin resistance protein/dioxygenase superfamily protein n=1 Tax=Kutzneria buriramensis TaxID=1045776 RepID=A0A3E0H3N1_9PSEU|nr:VOC family protein [Kutzneria buriramensis]REH37129.1 glyoxalase/bleomycin resistance protein/dioxygenase superfamily protein [Kutzneria buriramensis]